MKRVLPVVLTGLVAVAIVFAVAIAFGQNQPRITPAADRGLVA